MTYYPPLIRHGEPVNFYRLLVISYLYELFPLGVGLYKTSINCVSWRRNPAYEHWRQLKSCNLLIIKTKNTLNHVREDLEVFYTGEEVKRRTL